MSPKNLQSADETLPVVSPEAVNHTIAGNTNKMQANSYKPLMLTSPYFANAGTENRAKSIAHAIQNIPLIFTGLKLRAKSIPNENGNIILSRPPKKFTVSSVQPMPIISYPETSVVTNQHHATPNAAVSTANARLPKRRIMSA